MTTQTKKSSHSYTYIITQKLSVSQKKKDARSTKMATARQNYII